MRQSQCLLLAAVCGVHLLVISSFSNSGKSSVLTDLPHLRMQVQLVDVPVLPSEPVKNTKEQITPPPPAAMSPPKKAPAAPLAASVAASDQVVAATPFEAIDRQRLPFFNRDRFLDADQLDQPASASIAFADALDKALLPGFNLLVLEFLIDEDGRVIQLACIEGDCSSALPEQLQSLLAMPFTPASKNGRPVPSRKLVEILPTPTFGL